MDLVKIHLVRTHLICPLVREFLVKPMKLVMLCFVSCVQCCVGLFEKFIVWAVQVKHFGGGFHLETGPAHPFIS